MFFKSLLYLVWVVGILIFFCAFCVFSKLSTKSQHYVQTWVQKIHFISYNEKLGY